MQQQKYDLTTDLFLHGFLCFESPSWCTAKRRCDAPSGSGQAFASFGMEDPSYCYVLICNALTEGHRRGCGCCSSSEEQIPSTAPKSSYETKDHLKIRKEITTSCGSAWWAAVTANDTLCQQTQAVLVRLVVLRDGNGSGRAANALGFCFYSDI